MLVKKESLARSSKHTLINGTSDLLTGLAHYNGVSDIDKIQANQTAEFIYVSTDNTGVGIEYACLFANCFPRNIKNDQFNYTSGEHNLVEYNIEFSCTKYESIHINKVAKELINRYRLLANSLNFNSGITMSNLQPENGVYGRRYDIDSGKLKNITSADAKYLNTPKAVSGITVKP